MCAALAVALGVIIKQKHSLEHDNVNFHNATSYAEHNTCPDFLDPGQATLQSNRKPSSDQPNIFEELHTAELAAVSPSHNHALLSKGCTILSRMISPPCQHIMARIHRYGLQARCST